MTLDEFIARLQALRDEQPHCGALPFTVRAYRKRRQSLVLDLRFAGVERLSLDGLVHAEVAADLRAVYEASGASASDGPLPQRLPPGGVERSR